MLKKGSGKANAKDEARKEEITHECPKHRKKEWREKSNATKFDKNLDKWLEHETKSMKKEVAQHDERKRKIKGIGRILNLN